MKVSIPDTGYQYQCEAIGCRNLARYGLHAAPRDVVERTAYSYACRTHVEYLLTGAAGNSVYLRRVARHAGTTP